MNGGKGLIRDVVVCFFRFLLPKGKQGGNRCLLHFCLPTSPGCPASAGEAPLRGGVHCCCPSCVPPCLSASLPLPVTIPIPLPASPSLCLLLTLLPFPASASLPTHRPPSFLLPPPLLAAAIRAAFPQQQLVVYSGGLAAADTIALFQRARVVLGPHGAGLSHILFAAPGTTGEGVGGLGGGVVDEWMAGRVREGLAGWEACWEEGVGLAGRAGRVVGWLLNDWLAKQLAGLVLLLCGGSSCLLACVYSHSQVPAKQRAPDERVAGTLGV